MDSADRIATTHVGSLPRSEMVSDVVLAIEQGAAMSDELFDAVISDAVDVAVATQDLRPLPATAWSILALHPRSLKAWSWAPR